MIRIEIKSLVIAERSGISNNNGKPYTMREQFGWAQLFSDDGTPEPYPTKIKIGLEANQQPYPIGVYSVALNTFYVGKYDDLQLGRLKLQALPVPVQRAA